MKPYPFGVMWRHREPKAPKGWRKYSQHATYEQAQEQVQKLRLNYPQPHWTIARVTPGVIAWTPEPTISLENT